MRERAKKDKSIQKCFKKTEKQRDDVELDMQTNRRTWDVEKNQETDKHM